MSITQHDKMLTFFRTRRRRFYVLNIIARKDVSRTLQSYKHDIDFKMDEQRGDSTTANIEGKYYHLETRSPETWEGDDGYDETADGKKSGQGGWRIKVRQESVLRICGRAGENYSRVRTRSNSCDDNQHWHPRAS